MPTRRPDIDEKRREIIHQLTLAEQGEAAVQNAIGAKLAQGYFVKQDLMGALYWYAQAVKQGYTHAKWNAGTMLIEGEGVASAYVNLGMELIEQAATCGDVSACNFLSQCYAQGVLGKERDLSMSKKWSLAARDHEHFVEYGQPVDLEDRGIVLPKPQIEWP